MEVFAETWAKETPWEKFFSGLRANQLKLITLRREELPAKLLDSLDKALFHPMYEKAVSTLCEVDLQSYLNMCVMQLTQHNGDVPALPNRHIRTLLPGAAEASGVKGKQECTLGILTRRDVFEVLSVSCQVLEDASGRHCLPAKAERPCRFLQAHYRVGHVQAGRFPGYPGRFHQCCQQCHQGESG